jgi:radical SAM protein with 4Fe4S-binding SPASM domain
VIPFTRINQQIALILEKEGFIQSFQTSLDSQNLIVRLKYRSKAIYRGKKKEFNYCGAGKGLWALDVDGKLYHCHHLTNDSMHMIIDAAHATPEAIAEAIKISSLPPRDRSINDACQNCPALEFCNGGCWAGNYLTNKSATSPAPIECTIRIATTRAIGQFIIPTQTLENSNKTEMKMCGNCNTCQNCYQSCDTCDGCNTCQDCHTCQTCNTCESNCQTSCQSKCEDNCQSSCERKCQSCEDRCQERCDYHCEYDI